MRYKVKVPDDVTFDAILRLAQDHWQHLPVIKDKPRSFLSFENPTEEMLAEFKKRACVVTELKPYTADA